MNAKLIYIEVIVNHPTLIEANIRAKRRALGQGDTSPMALREHNIKVLIAVPSPPHRPWLATLTHCVSLSVLS